MISFRDLSRMVYLVGAADHKWFAESEAELDALLAIEDLFKAPAGVLGNKIDHYNFVSQEEPREQLGLVDTTGKGQILSA